MGKLCCESEAGSIPPKGAARSRATHVQVGARSLHLVPVGADSRLPRDTKEGGSETAWERKAPGWLINFSPPPDKLSKGISP